MSTLVTLNVMIMLTDRPDQTVNPDQAAPSIFGHILINSSNPDQTALEEAKILFLGARIAQ